MKNKNFLSFLILNIIFCLFFYLLDFRILFINVIMLILNTVLFFVLKNKNLEYNISVARHFLKTNKNLDKKDSKFLVNINNITKKLFLKDLKTIYYLFINIHIITFFYILINAGKSFKNFAVFICCVLFVNTILVFIKKIDLKFFIKYQDINTLTLINRFAKASTYKYKDMKFFIEKVDERINIERKKDVKNNDLSHYFKITNSLELFPYDTNALLEEKYEDILDKIYDLNRIIELDNDKLNAFNILQFEKCTTDFLSILNNHLKDNFENEEKEIIFNVLNGYEKYIDNIINNLK